MLAAASVANAATVMLIAIAGSRPVIEVCLLPYCLRILSPLFVSFEDAEDVATKDFL